MEQLMDKSAQKVAETLPFQEIEECLNNRIPEPVQERVVFWSFPWGEKDIQMYSSLSNCFRDAVKILDGDGVQDVLQVNKFWGASGMNLKNY